METRECWWYKVNRQNWTEPTRCIFLLRAASSLIFPSLHDMSFVFNWPRFSDQFHYDAIQLLNNALNKGTKPPVIADKIEVVELEMGTQVCPRVFLCARQYPNHIPSLLNSMSVKLENLLWINSVVSSGSHTPEMPILFSKPKCRSVSVYTLLFYH